MDELLPLFAGLTVLAGVLGSISIWTPRKVWLKCTALCTLSFFLPVAYFTMTDLLSRPKPADLEWLHRQADQAQVLGTRMKEGEAIYVWLQMEGVKEPRAYVLPWDQQLARQMHGAKREAESKGRPLMMGKPFQPSLEQRGKKFYAAPQPKLPPKTPAETNTPMEFEHRSSRDDLQTFAVPLDAGAPPHPPPRPLPLPDRDR